MLVQGTYMYMYVIMLGILGKLLEESVQDFVQVRVHVVC